MNTKGDLWVSRHLLSAIPLYLTQQNGNVYIFVIGNIQSFTSQIFGVVSPLGEKLDILVHWDLKFNDILIMKPQKSSSTNSEL